MADSAPYKVFDDLPEIARTGFKIVAEAEKFLNPSFYITSGANVGDGMMSEMLKVTIQGARMADGTLTPAQELKVICKMPPASLDRREFQRTIAVFKREIAVYTEYLPFLEDFQNRKGIKANDLGRFNNYPKCYYGKADETSGDAVLILEDLHESGHTMEKKSEPMSYEHCRLIFGVFGRLHGLSLAAQHDNPQAFDKFRTNFTDLVYYMMLDAHMDAVWETSFKNALEVLRDDEGDLKQALLHIKQNLRRNFDELLLLNSCFPYGVIGHGDSWINNFMFQRGGTNNAPHNITLIDWQATRYASPVLDLGYFLFTSIDKTLRDAHMDQLIAHYYETLCATANKAGYDGPTLLPFEELQRQLKSFAKYGLLMSLIVVPFMAVQSHELPNIDDKFKEWKDNGAEEGSELLQYISHRDETIAQRVANNIRDAQRLGYI